MGEDPPLFSSKFLVFFLEAGLSLWRKEWTLSGVVEGLGGS